MNCSLCGQLVASGDVNMHHPIPRSEGGQRTEPTHRDCHIKHHSTNNHFREWGRQGGLITATTKRWAFNLLGVRSHPAYDLARSFYVAHYAH